MIFKIIIPTVLITALFANTSNASNTTLKCYGCLASKISDCYNGVEESYIVQECKYGETNAIPLSYADTTINNDAKGEIVIETVCIQFTLAGFTPKIYQRGCGFIYKGVDICEYLANIEDIEECSYCTTDLCNKNPE